MRLTFVGHILLCYSILEEIIRKCDFLGIVYYARKRPHSSDMVLLREAETERKRAMDNKDVSVGNANTSTAHDNEKCMPTEMAKFALAIIMQNDQRFASMGGCEQDIAKSIAIYNFIRECSTRGVSGLSDCLEPHIRLLKRNAFRDQARKRTVKRRDKKTGKIEFVPRTVSCDAEINGDGAPTILETFVAKSSSGTETIEEAERQHEIQTFLSKVKEKVDDLPVDGRSKMAFALYVVGHTYESIARIVYGYSNTKTKKIYTNKVSVALHSIFVKLRAVYGDEAKMVLRPVRHVYERYV